MAELLVIRHGESTWNIEHRWAGQGDPALSDSGRETARAFAAKLAAVGFEGVVASDLRRARETAEILAHELSLPTPRLVAALRERHAGDWTGKTSEEIEVVSPGWLDRWRRGEMVDPPGAERRPDFAERVLGALHELGAVGEGRLLVVAHRGVLRVLEGGLGMIPTPAANLDGIWVRVINGSLRMIRDTTQITHP